MRAIGVSDIASIRPVAPLPVSPAPVVPEKSSLVVAGNTAAGIETGRTFNRPGCKPDVHQAITPVHPLDPARADKGMPARMPAVRIDRQIADHPVPGIHNQVTDQAKSAVLRQDDTPVDPRGYLQVHLLMLDTRFSPGEWLCRQ